MFPCCKLKTAIFLAVAAVLGGSLVAFALLRPSRQNSGSPGDHPAGFREISQQAGLTWRMNFLPFEQGENFKINLYDHGSAVAVGDYDGDGHDDVYLCNQLGPNALYHNRGDGTFEDVTRDAGVGLGDRVCTSATWADIDNKGRQYLFVTSTRGGNVLFKNKGNGKFEDVTKAARLDYIGHSQVAVFFDYDNDGYLDLFVGNTARWTSNEFDQTSKYWRGSGSGLLGIVNSPIEPDLLYHNNGNGTFTQVDMGKAGLHPRGWTGDVAVFDYDGDGYLDLLVTNMFGMSTLYRNNGNGTFTDVTLKVLKKTPWGGMGARAFDFNNDGLLDLFIVDMHSDMWMPVRYDWDPDQVEMFKRHQRDKYKYIGGPDKGNDLNRIFKVAKGDSVVFGNALYKNLGQGRFEEVSDKAGMETFWPWGIADGDFDNDGWVDVFIPSGMGYPFFYWPNQLMMNNGNETFTDRAETEGIEPPARGQFQEEKIGGRPAARSSRSAATADFRGDGRLDLIVNNFNDRPYYFQNHFPRKNYVELRLRGTKSNRDAVGAVARLYAGGQVLTRMVHPAGGYLAQSSKTLHFGLGDRTKIDRIEFTWPDRDHTVQVLRDVPINQLRDVVEGQP